jgi:Flp pilus assembly protein TadG
MAAATEMRTQMQTEHTAHRRFRLPRLWRPDLRRFRQTDTGQTLVEFAMVLPLMLILMFGIVDFGRAFYVWLTVTNAAREGARVAATQQPIGVVNTRISDAMGPLGTSQLTITPGNIQGPRGEAVTIDLTYNFSFVTPIGPLVALVGGSLATPAITSHASMRLE